MKYNSNKTLWIPWWLSHYCPLLLGVCTGCWTWRLCDATVIATGQPWIQPNHTTNRCTIIIAVVNGRGSNWLNTLKVPMGKTTYKNTYTTKYYSMGVDCTPRHNSLHVAFSQFRFNFGDITTISVINLEQHDVWCSALIGRAIPHLASWRWISCFCYRFYFITKCYANFGSDWHVMPG